MIVDNFKLEDVILVNFKSITNADTLISRDGKEYKIYAINIYLTKEQYDNILNKYGKEYKIKHRLNKAYLINTGEYVHLLNFRQFNQPLIICSGVDGKVKPKEITVNIACSLIKNGQYIDFNIDIINISKLPSNNELHNILSKQETLGTNDSNTCKNVYN